LNKEILKELILDEIILYHSPQAKAYNKRVGIQYPQGILEQVYEKQGESD